ncbi:hypothetical protein K440DRAFT_619788 [Wilcoxina mikolae CBS 423.85]|nr:hypothetical protein K440DRAFT_619788 [Wilcoxina mikolae CBS 423.85]
MDGERGGVGVGSNLDGTAAVDAVTMTEVEIKTLATEFDRADAQLDRLQMQREGSQLTLQ